MRQIRFPLVRHRLGETVKTRALRAERRVAESARSAGSPAAAHPLVGQEQPGRVVKICYGGRATLFVFLRPLARKNSPTVLAVHARRSPLAGDAAAKTAKTTRTLPLAGP